MISSCSAKLLGRLPIEKRPLRDRVVKRHRITSNHLARGDHSLARTNRLYTNVAMHLGFKRKRREIRMAVIVILVLRALEESNELVSYRRHDDFPQ